MTGNQASFFFAFFAILLTAKRWQCVRQWQPSFQVWATSRPSSWLLSERVDLTTKTLRFRRKSKVETQGFPWEMHLSAGLIPCVCSGEESFLNCVFCYTQMNKQIWSTKQKKYYLMPEKEILLVSNSEYQCYGQSICWYQQENCCLRSLISQGMSPKNDFLLWELRIDRNTCLLHQLLIKKFVYSRDIKSKGSLAWVQPCRGSPWSPSPWPSFLLLWKLLFSGTGSGPGAGLSTVRPFLKAASCSN